MARNATFSAQPDVAALLAQATAETGLHDFGDGQFRGSLEALVGFRNEGAGLGADDRGGVRSGGTGTGVAGGRRSPTRRARPGEVRGLMVTPAGTAQSRPG
jgi:hypothetical protein